MIDTLNSLALLAATYEDKEIVRIVFTVLMLVACIGIVITIMMQKGTNDNVGVISGASDTYYGKNKERNKEGILKKVTFGIFAFILVCAVVAMVVSYVVKVA